MSVWADLEDSISETVDLTFGETFEFRPMTQLTVNDPVAEDVTRAVRTVEGIYSAPSTEVTLGNTKPTRTKVLGGDGMTLVSLTAPRASFDERAFAAGERPRKGDRFSRVATLDLYQVIDIQPDGQGRLVLVLSHIVKESA